MAGHRAIALAVLTLTLMGCLREAPEPAAEVRATNNDIVVTAEDAVSSRIAIAPMPHLPGERDLTNEDIGIDPKIEAALPEIERIPDLVVPGPPAVDPPATGLPDVEVPGTEPPNGNGLGSIGSALLLGKFPGVFAGRSGAAKAKLLKQYGGTAESEKAVELGLAWLAKQQKKDGSWAFDAGQKEETAAATGLALLAYLGAGETHKDAKGKHTAAVKNGLQWLMKATPATGANAGRSSQNMYSQGIAALALCEAYGMTKDPALKPVAQAAVNYIQKSQGPNGSWSYGPKANGDTSITGWQVQALFAAKQAGLVVDDKVLKSAVKFLDFAAGGAKKSMYGYADSAAAAPGTALTASGLLSRHSIDGWGANHPGMIDGTAGLVKNPPAGQGGVRGLYYFYYATQVVRLSEGDDWKTWNEGPKDGEGKRKGGLRDWLIGQQITKDGANLGSWDPEVGYIGQGCGRLGTTAMCLLNLEVYYRYVPAEKKDANLKK